MDRKPLQSNVKEVLINNRLVTGRELANEITDTSLILVIIQQKSDSADLRSLWSSLSQSIVFAGTSPGDIFKVFQDLSNQAAAQYHEDKAVPLKIYYTYP